MAGVLTAIHSKVNLTEMLFGLSHLFFPWGILLQAVALIHAIRRRPDTYWYWIIFIGGFLGALVYIVMEMIPDTRLLGNVFTGFNQPTRNQKLEGIILYNTSSGNYEELGDLLLEQKKYARARDCYDQAIAARASSADAFYWQGICSLELGDAARAIGDIESVVKHEARCQQ